MSTITIDRRKAAEWEKANPVLRDGEPGVEITSNRMKIGDGRLPWTRLPWLSAALTYELRQELAGGGVGGTGLQGPKGDKGDPGTPGAASTVPGPKGDKGDPGDPSTVPGPKGDKGDPGTPGAAGAASTVPGPKGDKGDTGATGAKGDKGDFGGNELWSGEDATDVNNVAGAAASDLPGTIGSFTVPAGGRPVYFEYGALLKSTVVNGLSVVQLVVDGVAVTNSLAGGTSATANAQVNASRVKRVPLAAGDHTCKLQLVAFTGSSTATSKGSGGAPAYLHVTLR